MTDINYDNLEFEFEFDDEFSKRQEELAEWGGEVAQQAIDSFSTEEREDIYQE